MELLFLLLILAVLAPLLSSRVSSGQHRNYHSQWTLPQEQSTTSAASQAEADTLSYDKAYQKKWLLTMKGVLPAIMQLRDKEKYDRLH